MKKNICWKDSEITKIARRLLAIAPPAMIAKIRDQVKNGTNSRVHGLYEYINDAQSVLPTDRRKLDRMIDLPNVNRIKATVAAIRSSSRKNYYQPKSVTKSKTSQPEVKITEAVVNKLCALSDVLKSLGLTAENQRKVLNQVVSFQ